MIFLSVCYKPHSKTGITRIFYLHIRLYVFVKFAIKLKKRIMLKLNLSVKIKNGKLIFLIFLLLLFLGFISFLLLKPSKIEKYRVEKKKMVVSIYASGYIDSSDSVIIKPEVAGQIEKILVREGDEVKKDQLLLIISNSPVKENLREVEAQLASVRERLKPDSDFRKELMNNIEIKKAILENIEKNFNRKKALFEEELISKERFEDIKREYEVAKRDYERQLNQYKDTITNLNYQFESLKAKRQALSSELNKYYIKAPFKGKILRKFVNEGDYVNPMQHNNALLSLGNDENLETILFVDEEYIPRIKEGMKVYVTLDSYPGEVFQGSIKSIESQSDRTTRTVKVKAQVNYMKPIFFGLTVEANVIISEIEGIFIPQSAYKDGYVEVLESGKPKKIKIKVSPEKYSGNLLVLEGLTEGQEIIK